MSLTLSPSEIRYSQDSISHKFSDGHLLTSTFAQLISGQLSVSSLRPLKCSIKNGNWFAASGNRRLFLYKKLQEAGAISTITVLRSSSNGRRNFTTKCDGMYIRCRGLALEYQIEEIIAQWKRGKDVVAKGVTLTEAAPVSPVASSFGENDEFDFDDFYAYEYYDRDDYDHLDDHGHHYVPNFDDQEDDYGFSGLYIYDFGL